MSESMPACQPTSSTPITKGSSYDQNLCCSQKRPLNPSSADCIESRSHQSAGRASRRAGRQRVRPHPMYVGRNHGLRLSSLRSGVGSQYPRRTSPGCIHSNAPGGMDAGGSGLLVGAPADSLTVARSSGSPANTRISALVGTGIPISRAADRASRARRRICTCSNVGRRLITSSLQSESACKSSSSLPIAQARSQMKDASPYNSLRKTKPETIKRRCSCSLGPIRLRQSRNRCAKPCNVFSRQTDRLLNPLDLQWPFHAAPPS